MCRGGCVCVGVALLGLEDVWELVWDQNFSEMWSTGERLGVQICASFVTLCVCFRDLGKFTGLLQLSCLFPEIAFIHCSCIPLSSQACSHQVTSVKI